MNTLIKTDNFWNKKREQDYFKVLISTVTLINVHLNKKNFLLFDLYRNCSKTAEATKELVLTVKINILCERYFLVLIDLSRLVNWVYSWIKL